MAVSNVERFPSGAIQGKAPPDHVLEEAKAARLREVIVIGWRDDEDGTLYTGASMEDGPTALWLLELAKQTLIGSPER